MPNEEETPNVSRWESSAAGEGVVKDSVKGTSYNIPCFNLNGSSNNDDTQYYAGYQPRNPDGDWEITRAFDFTSTSENGGFEVPMELNMRPTLWSRLKGMWRKQQNNSDVNSYIEVQPMPIQSSTDPHNEEDKLTSLLTSCKALMAGEDRTDRENSGSRISINLGLGLIAVVIFNVSMWLSLPSPTYNESIVPDRVALIVQHANDIPHHTDIVHTSEHKLNEGFLAPGKYDRNIIGMDNSNDDSIIITAPPSNNNYNHKMRIVNNPNYHMDYNHEHRQRYPTKDFNNDEDYVEADDTNEDIFPIQEDDQKNGIDQQQAETQYNTENSPGAVIQNASNLRSQHNKNLYVKGSAPLHAAKLQKHNDSNNSILIE